LKQVLQSLANGETDVVDVPAPAARAGHVLVYTSASVVSAGTERMLVEFGRAGWIQKALQQPEKVRMVLEKARTDGIGAAIEAVRSKLDQPLALGYCNAGRIAELGIGVEGLAVGDRVVSNGNHAEVVCVPRNLCARIPDSVSDEHAAFTVVGAIGLQGIRLANPTLGETVVVTGLGLIGLMTVQMLRALGCRVLGIDLDPTRLALAARFGAEVVKADSEEPVLATAKAFSRGIGVDAVIVTASTKSSDPIHQAAQMCRKRGRIVLVGVTGLELSRADFYEKELTFQVSCSYGPGRYDPNYEEGGQDYPVGFVRWTEQRNFEAVLDLMASGRLDVGPLVSHRFAVHEAQRAYELLATSSEPLGIVLTYPGKPEERRARDVRLRVGPVPAMPSAGQHPRVAFLGAGNYATRALMPAFQAAGAEFRIVVSEGGVSAERAGRKFGFASASTDPSSAISDAESNVVVVATRHDAHASQVLAALRAGKHVFCEKPLCLTLEELAQIDGAVKSSQASPGQLLMVGFNRRFSPLAVKMKTLLAPVAEPKVFVMTVNAGHIDADHWTQDKSVGGGRIVGEACHFIDLLRHLDGSPIVECHAASVGRHPAFELTDDKATLTLRFASGSLGTIHYLANGNRAVPKERLEVFCGGKVLQLDNFRRLRGWGWQGFSSTGVWGQDKGQHACVRAFLEAVSGGRPSPIPLEEVLESSRVAIEAQAALR
jgi:predicted dehydrogenase/threonine dehydrogenase-like Zn-dependent dehydrogenase